MRVAINGFGRIGRAIFKIGLDKGLDIVAINDLMDIKNLVYLLKHDSVYHEYGKKIVVKKNSIIFNGKKIIVLAEKDPKKLPWKKLGVGLVLECTGFFTERKDVKKHLEAGAKKVIISAPAKNPDVTIVLGVNEKILKKEHKIISLASCTTNCLAPIVKVLNDEFGIERGFMTTVHAYTSTQSTLDGPDEKLRRGRAAAENIVPTTSGATKATGEVIPELKGKIDGLAMRVPVACGSIVDFVAELNEIVVSDRVNKILKKASKKLKGILQYTEDELVSSDIIGNTHSAIIDGLSTQSIGKIVKVLGWYDNEWGYSSRMVDLAKKLR